MQPMATAACFSLGPIPRLGRRLLAQVARVEGTPPFTAGGHDAMRQGFAGGYTRHATPRLRRAGIALPVPRPATPRTLVQYAPTSNSRPDAKARVNPLHTCTMPPGPQLKADRTPQPQLRLPVLGRTAGTGATEDLSSCSCSDASGTIKAISGVSTRHEVAVDRNVNLNPPEKQNGDDSAILNKGVTDDLPGHHGGCAAGLFAPSLHANAAAEASCRPARATPRME